ncbi:MAG: hypothetical protein ABIJ61_14565 [bacterium]
MFDKRDRVRFMLWVCLVACLCSAGAFSCEPEFYFLMRDEARSKLRELQAGNPDRSLFQQFVLMHNLAFHKDRKMRERAEALFEDKFQDSLATPIFRAYAGSLLMIRVSQRSKGSSLLRVLNPLTPAPHAEARVGYRKISEAVAADSTNPTLRLLRATAATESADHLPELCDSARVDLEWLSAWVSETDSVALFLVELNWAKYYYRLAVLENRTEFRREALAFAERARSVACTPVYRELLGEWRQRILALSNQD